MAAARSSGVFYTDTTEVAINVFEWVLVERKLAVAVVPPAGAGVCILPPYVPELDGTMYPY